MVGDKHQKEEICSKLISLSLKPSEHVRNLGVIVDPELNITSHIPSITRTAFYHLKKKYSKVISFCFSQMLKNWLMLSSPLDLITVNALLAGLLIKIVGRLQLIQNAAARVLTGTRKMEHITPILKILHWLSIKYSVDFKILCLKST